MAEQESNYDPTVIGDNGHAYGLLQIQPRWHKERMDKLGITKKDLLDPYRNVDVAVDYLEEIFDCYDDVYMALMAYNGGMSYADKMLDAEKVSGYALNVATNAHYLEIYGRRE